MGMLRAVMQNARTIRASIDPCWRKKWMPCFKLLNIDSLVVSGTKRADMSKRVTTGARKDKAFSPKHHFSPRRAKVIPASAGPTVTARLNWIELSAMAFGMSSRSTSVGISA